MCCWVIFILSGLIVRLNLASAFSVLQQCDDSCWLIWFWCIFWENGTIIIISEHWIDVLEFSRWRWLVSWCVDQWHSYQWTPDSSASVGLIFQSENTCAFYANEAAADWSNVTWSYCNYNWLMRYPINMKLGVLLRKQWRGHTHMHAHNTHNTMGRRWPVWGFILHIDRYSFPYSPFKHTSGVF